MRISLAGNFVVIDESGGSITIEYETSRLRLGESFIVFVDGKTIKRESPSDDGEKYSDEKDGQVSFDLSPGEHIV